MGSSSMKVHQFPRGFWDHIIQPAQQPSSLVSSFSSESSSSDVVCKRVRSPPPKMAHSNHNNSNVASLDLKSFIRPDSGPRKLSASSDHHLRCTKHNQSAAQVETHPGGTRWNPTQEQIGILEMLYKGGMRTPNANQIEQITDRLAKYGKIEGKNVFYWFQNHKARERQKIKRERLGHTLNSPTTTTPPHSPAPIPIPAPAPATATAATAKASNNITTMLNMDDMLATNKEERHLVCMSGGVQKRRCRSWTFDEELANEEAWNDGMKNSRSCRSDDEGSACTTLQLFPLHPERKR